MKKLIIFFSILACVSCSKQNTAADDTNDQVSYVPVSLDGIWQCGDPAISLTFNDNAVQATLFGESDGIRVRGTLFYDTVEGTGQIVFDDSEGVQPFDASTHHFSITGVEIIQAIDGSLLGPLLVEGEQQESIDAVPFDAGGPMMLAAVTKSNGAVDTCMFLGVVRPSHTAQAILLNYGSKGVRELKCNNGMTVRTDNWMSNIPDNTPLRRLAIPGTHDAATSSILTTTLGKDQMFTLEEQLDMGVRYFDLRIGDSGRITHGGSPTKYTFDSALAELSQWQSAHPTEGVLIEIRWEKDKIAYTEYEILIKAQVAAAKAYNASLGRLLGNKPVPDLEAAMEKWEKDSMEKYVKTARSVLEKYNDALVSIGTNLTVGQLRGKISVYDSQEEAVVDVSKRVEKAEYPDSRAMTSDEKFQKRIEGVVKAMREYTTTTDEDEYFGRLCVSGYIEPWATKGQIPFTNEMTPHILKESEAIVSENKTSHAIFLMDYAPLALEGQGRSFCENLIMMNFQK